MQHGNIAVPSLETKPVYRVAVVLAPKIPAGAAINAAAIVVGGLQCKAFDTPIQDAGGTRHAAIKWNLVVLEAKTTGQIQKLVSGLADAENSEGMYVVFTATGRALNNSFDAYAGSLVERPTDFSDIIAVGIYGEDTYVRGITKPFSVFK